MAKKQPVKPKERGCLLTGIIVLIVIHGIIGTAAYYAIRTQEALDRPWLITLMVLHSILNIIAAFGIWNWKRWGIQLYAVSTAISVVVGMVSVGAWSIFYFILPLVILGYVIKSRWKDFGMDK